MLNTASGAATLSGITDPSAATTIPAGQSRAICLGGAAVYALAPFSGGAATAATGYTLSQGATSGGVGTADEITLAPTGGYWKPGNITLTASLSATFGSILGGTLSGSTITPAFGSAAVTLAVTPEAAGTMTLSAVNTMGLSNPANLTYTVSSPPSFGIPNTTALFRMNAASPSTIATQGGQGAFGAVVTGWSDDNGGAAIFSSATPGFVYTQNALGSHPGLEGTVTTYGYTVPMPASPPRIRPDASGSPTATGAADQVMLRHTWALAPKTRGSSSCIRTQAAAGNGSSRTVAASAAIWPARSPSAASPCCCCAGMPRATRCSRTRAPRCTTPLTADRQ